MADSEWSIADAKTKLSEVLNRAEREVQIITRRGRRYIVMDGDQYQRLAGNVPSLKDLILNGPSLEDVELGRDTKSRRDFDL